jgi:dipeptidase E
VAYPSPLNDVRAFLGSQGLGALGPWLDGLPRRPATVTMIPTGSNRYREAPWVDAIDRALTDLGLSVQRLDLEGATPSVVEADLADTDLVFVTGGHTLFLAEHARRSGFYSIVRGAVRAGKLAYAGMSSGGFLAGPNPLHTVDPADPGEVRDTRGLGIVPIIPLSHANRGREAEHRALIASFGDRFTLVPITDEQAIIVAGETWEVRPSAPL